MTESTKRYPSLRYLRKYFNSIGDYGAVSGIDGLMKNYAFCKRVIKWQFIQDVVKVVIVISGLTIQVKNNVSNVGELNDNSIKELSMS